MSFQGTVLDGHALILQHCQVKKDDEVLSKAEKDKSSTKLLVRNVAFEATEKDLRMLFSPFGKVECFSPPSFESYCFILIIMNTLNGT